MTSDAPTSKISSEPSEAIEWAKKIERHNWWQGSIVISEQLRQANPASLIGVEAFEYWIVASQTCNLVNPDFEKVRYVEWVGARKIDTLDSRYSDGSNPRVLQIKATDSKITLLLECDIQARLWTARKFLADIEPNELAVKDGAKKSSKEKDKFAGWLARSYTRLELSDALNAALNHSRLPNVFKALAKHHADDIFGVFLEISPETIDVSAERLAHMNPVDIVPPCSIQVVIVCEGGSKIQEIKKFTEDKFKEPVKLEDRTNKVSKSALAKEKQLTITNDSFSVIETTRWTIDKMQKHVRFSFLDHFSSSDEVI